MNLQDRSGFIAALPDLRDRIVDAARRLIAVASPNPPLDTRAVARVAAELIGEFTPGCAAETIETGDGVVNVLATVRGHAPGRRIVFSGHLDTYPVNEALPWSVDPLGGLVRDGRIHGRGACDMKGGIAASIAAFAHLALHSHLWTGEVVLALAGDEESMGERGTKWLLDHRPEATGDAVVIGDVGSPDVLRFGEKGFLWIDVEAAGKPAHGAHVHLGVNAIERLNAALQALAAALRAMAVPTPPEVAAAIAAAAPVSELLAGAGESKVLGSVTVNIGRIEGGTSPNLVPATARAQADIRLPVGVSCAAAEAVMRAVLEKLPGVSWRVFRRFEPNHTDPRGDLVRIAMRAAGEIRGHPIVVNMRVGGSDARWFRMRGIPTIVYGPTPFQMGGADEYVLIDDLVAVAGVHALTALDFLSAEPVR